MSPEEILDYRKNKFLKIGRDQGFNSNSEKLSVLEYKENAIKLLLKINKKKISYFVGVILLSAISIIYFL